MAIINCPECQACISEDALHCPYCGSGKVSLPKRIFFMVIILGLFVVLLLAVPLL
jgi:RNA polymerase subunit RPABC4/transcription elongation factor Spt4